MEWRWNRGRDGGPGPRGSGETGDRGRASRTEHQVGAENQSERRPGRSQRPRQGRQSRGQPGWSKRNGPPSCIIKRTALQSCCADKRSIQLLCEVSAFKSAEGAIQIINK